MGYIMNRAKLDAQRTAEIVNEYLNDISPKDLPDINYMINISNELVSDVLINEKLSAKRNAEHLRNLLDNYIDEFEDMEYICGLLDDISTWADRGY